MTEREPAELATGLEAASGPAPRSLYVHVPFCVSLCPYCDFVVYTGRSTRGPRSRIDAFVGALSQELELRADIVDARFGALGSVARRPLDTLYFGGGTPSLLPPASIAALVQVVRERFGLATEAEVTLEANPGPDDRGDATGFADAGVTRLSLGAQSFQDEELRTLGRRHRGAHVADAVLAARSARIASINIDLLYDVPGQTLASWTDSLERALALAPDHVSLYALTLDDPDAEGLTGELGDHLPTRSGARRWRAASRRRQDDERATAMYHHATALLAGEGWRAYEISNWARRGHESRHNLAYWWRQPYEAVGPGAHAFDGTRRRWNAARLEGYLAALQPPDGSKPILPPGSSETVDASTAAAESMILGLRLDTGVPAELMAEPALTDAFAWAKSLGFLLVDGSRVRLTTRGRLFSNELFARLI
ncbi:MAG: radical SAM family heme chaperone HemW [Chloroflexi bacterium]|nr:MAG: radical SAM family heme chaperone HemW [Chloroflexota bacterium]